MQRFFHSGKTGGAPQEYIDFLLMKDVYHCTPSELDEQDASKITLHINFLNMQQEESIKDQRRAEQRSKPW